jgi:hypothetical protein
MLCPCPVAEALAQAPGVLPPTYNFVGRRAKEGANMQMREGGNKNFKKSKLLT